MSNEHENADLGRSPIEGLVHRVLRMMGALLPRTADEVAEAERQLGERKLLPAELLDPDRVFHGTFRASLSSGKQQGANVVDLDVVEGFSAAARNGGAISEEREKKLSDDWDEAIRRREDEDGR